MKKYNFISSNKKIITWSTMVCIFSVCVSFASCKYDINDLRSSKTSEPTTEYALTTSEHSMSPIISTTTNISESKSDLPESQVGPETEITSQESTSKPRATGFNDYFDDPAPKEKEIFVGTFDYNGKDVLSYTYTSDGDSLFVFGFDNPQLTKNVQELVGDNTIDAYNINCFQDFYKITNYYNDPFYSYADYIKSKDFRKLELDFIRYVFAANDKKFMIDIMSWSDFVNTFTNSDSIINNSFDTIYTNPSFDKYIKSNVRYFSESNLFDDVTSDNDFLTIFALDSYITYQKLVEGAGFSLNQMGDQVKIDKSDVDGKYFLRPTEGQYNYMMKTISETYGVYIDTVYNGPETREDLIASGVEVEKIDEIVDALGLKRLESLEQDKGSQRSLG